MLEHSYKDAVQCMYINDNPFYNRIYQVIQTSIQIAAPSLSFSFSLPCLSHTFAAS